MSYRNKTFVSFASEDIHYYRLMRAWRENSRFDFDFHDAHDLNTARDTSSPMTINLRLRERLKNTKQVIMLIGDITRRKAATPGSFIGYEARTIKSLEIPIIFANLNKSRVAESNRIPEILVDLFSVSVSFNPAIIKYALDSFPDEYRQLRRTKHGPHEYSWQHYDYVGL